LIDATSVGSELMMEPNLTDRLTDALQRAAAAHGLHEQELGQPDPDWLQWYAEHMARTLTEDGYRLIRLDPHQHRGVQSGEGVS
jgi:hypothetical protein